MRHLLLPLAALALSTPTAAFACGGFFCAQVPMDQSKERIVFSVDDGTIDVHVQIFYAGEADRFAWVVPVAGVPEVALSTDVMFQVLDQATMPRFQLEYSELGSCEFRDFGATEDSWDADDGATGAPSAPGAGGGAEVLAEGQTGPYDWKVVSATSEEALLEWLEDNDYDIPPAVGKALGGYLAGGSNFVAFKLTADSDTGDITPVRLTYPGDRPLIPLVLTSIAATPDMRLQPYVFADERAVPENYLHVQINEAAVDWLSGGANYDDVITRAANEAGGQAFATDYSGSTDRLDRALWWPGRYDLDALAAIDDPILFFESLQGQGFAANATLLNLLEEHIPLPASLEMQGVDARSFYNCLRCYEEALDGQAFDPIAFVDDLDVFIVDPLKDAQAMFDRHDTVSRLTSSMSPDEMTLDPTFVLNPDMGPVSNIHEADLVTDCRVETDGSKAPRHIELADGRIVGVPSQEWFWENPGQTWYDEDAPAASTIERTAAAGQPVPVRDQSEAADDSLDAHNDWVARINGAAPGGEPAVKAASCADGCSQSGSGSALAGLGLVGLLASRRRRNV